LGEATMRTISVETIKAEFDAKYEAEHPESEEG
jgi:hypothetical protein